MIEWTPQRAENVIRSILPEVKKADVVIHGDDVRATIYAVDIRNLQNRVD